MVKYNNDIGLDSLEEGDGQQWANMVTGIMLKEEQDGHQW